MGKSAGTLTAAIVSNFSHEAMLRSATPDVLLSTIGDLPGFLLESGAAP